MLKKRYLSKKIILKLHIKIPATRLELVTRKGTDFESIVSTQFHQAGLKILTTRLELVTRKGTDFKSVVSTIPPSELLNISNTLNYCEGSLYSRLILLTTLVDETA